MRIALFAAIALLVSPSLAFAGSKCVDRAAAGHHIRLCLRDPGPLKHWLFSLEVDGETIFVLVDDYVENISLTHTILDGPSIEFPLSKQGGNKVTISGGCVPVVSPQKTEVARQCNFMWGNIAIIKDVKFVH